MEAGGGSGRGCRGRSRAVAVEGYKDRDKYRCKYRSIYRYSYTHIYNYRYTTDTHIADDDDPYHCAQAFGAALCCSAYQRVMVSGMVSCRPGASQPGTPPPATRAVVVAVGSFNFGLPQAMIDSFRGSSPASEKTVAKHCRNFARICKKMVLAGELDILFGCEVGGPREGFHCQRIDVRDILEKPFGPTVSVTSIDNYIAVTGFQNSSCFLHGTSRKVTFLGDRFDAAITHYDILPGGASQPAAHVIVGNLHIVCGSKDKPPKLATRQRIVCELRNELEKCPVPDLQVPVVRLIVGDDNLSTDEARQALRQETDTDPLWEVFPAREEGRGDHSHSSPGSVSLYESPFRPVASRQPSSIC